MYTLILLPATIPCQLYAHNNNIMCNIYGIGIQSVCKRSDVFFSYRIIRVCSIIDVPLYVSTCPLIRVMFIHGDIRCAAFYR